MLTHTAAALNLRSGHSVEGAARQNSVDWPSLNMRCSNKGFGPLETKTKKKTKKTVTKTNKTNRTNRTNRTEARTEARPKIKKKKKSHDQEDQQTMTKRTKRTKRTKLTKDEIKRTKAETETEKKAKKAEKRCGESNPLVRLEPCLCVVLSQINSARVAVVHTPAKPVCGRHVIGTVVS